MYRQQHHAPDAHPPDAPRRLGRERIGFEAVDDWNHLRTALAARGHGVGLTTMNHLAGELLGRARTLLPPGDDGGGEP
ncbi:hypothetical protein BRC75_02170 [Halobacteriales archaeon QH_7_69_31]|nr:MAG: hypothetical protein BRC75_02170 [Halobacteriales archaeon QH_7_69_31]